MTTEDSTETPTENEDGSLDVDEPIERTFTCSLCGFATTYEVGLLRTEVQSVCVNCGDWTVQTAALEDVVESARDVAGELAGAILTERQALAYLLRDVVGVERGTTAEAMDSSPSNVDNLRRRGAEKVAAAEELVAGLDALVAPAGEVTDGESDEKSEADGESESDDEVADGIAD